MIAPKATSRSDSLSAVVSLGKQLSTIHDPHDQLLAYCRAVTEIRGALARVYVAFFQGGDLLPRGVVLFEREAGRLLFLGTEELTFQEKKLFREFSRRRRQRTRGRRPALPDFEEQEFADVLFQERPASARRRSATVGGGKKTNPRLNLADSFPLRSRSGRAQGWVLLAFPDPASFSRDGEGRNAVSVCTGLLSASLDRVGLFAKVLRAKKEWERSVDAIGDIVMIVSRDHAVIRGNRRLAELAGVQVEVMRGTPCHSLLSALKKPCPNCPVEASFRTGKGRTGEIHRSRGDAVFEVSSYPILDSSGRPDSVAVYEKDVTIYKQMQEKLVQAEKMAVLGELAAAVAHELNNPLSGVISFSKILLSEMDPSLPHVDDIRNIEHGAMRCKKIVQDLLVFSRKPATVKHEPVRLAAIVEEAQAWVRPQLAQKGVTLRSVLPAGLPDLPFHPDLVHQVLVNLITNAMDASKEGGSIEIRAGRRNRKGSPFLGITVRDTGSGIPPRIRNKVFDAFFTTKGPGHGTGLGLSICRNLMDAFGGAIEVTSTPGRGTTFLLLFPL